MKKKEDAVSKVVQDAKDAKAKSKNKHIDEDLKSDSDSEPDLSADYGDEEGGES